MIKRLFWMALAIVAIVRMIDLQRRLEAAISRGDMYRDISIRLDRELAEVRQHSTI